MMLIGKKHKIHRALKPLCLAIDKAIKTSFDCVSSPDTMKAISSRDAVLAVQTEMDKIIFGIESRKWKQ